MRKEKIFCDGCGKDITDANMIINNTHLHINFKIDDWIIPVHGYFFFDACSWECFLKCLQIRFYEEATRQVSLTERKLIKDRLSKIISSLGDDENENVY
jgi:shikimate 5-dehydrogenase